MKRALWFVLAAATVLACAAPALPAAQPPDVEEGAPAPGVGQAAPAIALKAIDGSPLTLARGRVTVIVFWATWSEPDKRELIKLQEVYARLGPGRLAVIALSVEDAPTELARFAETYGLRFPIAWDAEHRVAQRYRPSSEPSTYVVDRDGIIRFVHPGYHDGEMNAIASEIESLTR